MENNDWTLFRQALTEGMTRRYEGELAACDTDASVSAKFKRRMRRILKNAGENPGETAEAAAEGRTGGRRSLRRRYIAVLIAAALLLAGGITACAKREAIIYFIRKVFDGYDEISYQTDGKLPGAPETIEKAYCPTYLPEGYETVDHMLSPALNRWEWENARGNYLRFMQGVLEGGMYFLDNEDTTSETVTIGDYSVYVAHIDELDSYIWNDGSYSYNIQCNEKLPLEEIERMILSIAEEP